MSKPFNFYQDYKGAGGESGFPTADGFLTHFYTPPNLIGDNSFVFSLLRDSEHPTTLYSTFSGAAAKANEDLSSLSSTVWGKVVPCLYDRGNIYEFSFTGRVTSGDHFYATLATQFNGAVDEANWDGSTFCFNMTGAQTGVDQDYPSLSSAFSGESVSGNSDLPSLWSSFRGNIVGVLKERALMDLEFNEFKFCRVHLPINVGFTGNESGYMDLSFESFVYTPLM